MRKVLSILSICLLIIIMCGCKTNHHAYYTYATHCLGVELDGSQTLLAWGEGKNKADAEEQAKKNAVRDVLFKGINAGKSDCTKVPLVNTPNAQRKYEDYFNAFFADGGDYLSYVTMADQKKFGKNKERYQYGEKRSVIVRVLRSELKKRLQDDGILPK